MTHLRFRITFKRSTHTIAEVEGDPRPLGLLHVADVTEKIVQAEAFLEKLTGLRVHIDQVA